MISILVPTRKRPGNMERLWQSAIKTAESPSDIEIVFYIDDDDSASIGKFGDIGFDKRIKAVIGDRILLSNMWNECYKQATGPYYQHCCDEIVFRTEGWDTTILQHFDEYPDKILFVHGRDGLQNGRIGTHGFLHKNWVETVGYFVPPYFSCDYNDTWLTFVADALKRRIYLPGLFVEHMHPDTGKAEIDDTHFERLARGHRDNIHELFHNLIGERQVDANKLRQFIADFKEKDDDGKST
jgi:hypothetical protein